LNKKTKTFQSKILNYPKDTDCVEKSARVIQKGGLIVFPTKGLYGIGADIFNFEAVSKIYEIKQRPLLKPVLIFIKDISEAEIYCKNIPEQAKILMKKLWPGDITFILEASDKTPKILTGNTGKIGVRVPAHPFAADLLKKLNTPLTGTSANISGNEASGDPDKIDIKIIEKTDLFINAGYTGEEKPSTIIEAGSEEIKILRSGRISEKEIKYYLL
jgi:L-threonylcarbamoyladenylate synthase